MKLKINENSKLRKAEVSMADCSLVVSPDLPYVTLRYWLQSWLWKAYTLFTMRLEIESFSSENKSLLEIAQLMEDESSMKSWWNRDTVGSKIFTRMLLISERERRNGLTEFHLVCSTDLVEVLASENSTTLQGSFYDSFEVYKPSN